MPLLCFQFYVGRLVELIFELLFLLVLLLAILDAGEVSVYLREILLLRLMHVLGFVMYVFVQLCLGLT